VCIRKLQFCFMGLCKIRKLLRRLRILLTLAEFIPSDIKLECQVKKVNIISKPRVLIVIHAYWYDEFKYILKKIHSLKSSVEILITLPDSPDIERINLLLNSSDFKHVLNVYKCSNEGRDIGPFVQALKKVDLNKFDNIIKIHTKRSQRIWFKSLANSLIRSDIRINKLTKKISKSEVGILVHPVFRYPGYLYKRDLMTLYQLPCDVEKINNLKWSFPAGSMFAIKPMLLAKLLEDWGNLEFENEDFYSQYSLAHKLERRIGYDSCKYGFKITATSIFDYFDIKSYFVKII
jgi:lipopolysaccharide biosynthesis protein